MSRHSIVAAAVLLVIASWASTQVLPEGDEFLVNTATEGGQRIPTVALDETGNFLIIWHNYDSGAEVRAQWFTSTGSPAGPEFRVDTGTPPTLGGPCVALAGTNSPMVVWTTLGGDLASDITGRAVSTLGSPIGSPFLVNSITVDTQNGPWVSMSDSGVFVATWTAEAPSEPTRVMARRFWSAASPIGTEFQVNTSTIDPWEIPAVAVGPNGHFVVSWAGDFQMGVQAYNASGTPVGSEFTPDPDHSSYHRIVPAVDADGNFVLVWNDTGSILGRLYDSSANPRGDAFVIQAPDQSNWEDSYVTMDSGGNFVVTYDFYSGVVGDVFGKAYLADGTPLGERFYVSTDLTVAAEDTHAALNDNGDLVVTWGTWGNDDADGDDSGVFARRFQVVFPSFISIESDTYEVAEDAGSVTLTVQRTGDPDGIVAVQWTTFDGTAHSGAGEDFLAPPPASWVVWGNGDTADKTISVTILNDAVAEGHEQFTVSIHSPSGGAVLGEPNIAEVTILDNDTSVLELSSAAFEVDEDGGPAAVTVTRSGGLSGMVTVDLDTSDGTATDGLDYTDISATLTWADGVGGDQQADVPITADSIVETDETVLIDISNPTGGAVLGDQVSAVLTILEPLAGGLVTSEGPVVRLSDPNDGGTSPDVDMDGTGSALVVWHAWGPERVIGRWFDSAGEPATGRFDVQQTSFASPDYPHVDVAPSGVATVVWNDIFSVFARQLPALSSSPTADQYQLDDVLSTTHEATANEGVGVHADGSGLAAWRTSDRIAARPLGPTAAPSGDAFHLSADGQMALNMAADSSASGHTVVVWHYSDLDEIAAYRLDASGTPVGSEITVATGITLADIEVAVTEDGSFAVVWSTDEVYARFYDSSGNPLGAAFQVNSKSQSPDYGRQLHLTFDSWGNSVVVWHRSDYTVFGRLLAPGGTPLGVDFQINAGTASEGFEPRVALDDQGQFMVVWRSWQTESGNRQVLSRRFHGVFPPVLGFSPADYEVDEAGGTVTLYLQRQGSSSGAVTVDWDTADGTAVAPGDYTADSDTLSWAEGDTADKEIVVAIVSDGDAEGDEMFTVELSNPTGGAFVGANSEAEVTILDDDVSRLQFSSATFAVDEDAGPAVVTVTRTGGLAYGVDVDYDTYDVSATAGADFTALSSTLHWDPNDATDRTINVPIANDSDDEGPETFEVRLSNPTSAAILGSPSETVVTINDDDHVGIVFSSTTYSATEHDAEATITVLRVGMTAGAVGVTYATSDGTATAGEDYTTASDTLSWADGDGDPKVFTVPITDDQGGEGDETVNLTLSNPTGGASVDSPGTAVLTISDNDACTLQLTAATFDVLEEGGSAEVWVSRVGDTSGAVTVDYSTGGGTATAGLDYTSRSDTLSWTAGDGANKSFTVPIIDDDLLEGAETIGITLSNPTGNGSLGDPSTGTVAISDNEGREMQVNTFTPSAQTNPRVAVDRLGNTLVVWESHGQDGDDWGIFKRRIDPDGNPIGGDVRVNSFTAGAQRIPAVAMSPDGRAVVAWQSTGQDGNLTGVFAQRYDGSGAAAGGEFLVNLSTESSQAAPAVAVADDGSFVVVWQSYGQDGSGQGVFGRLFAADGSPLTGEVAVNTHTDDNQEWPSCDASGQGYVAAWESSGQESLGGGVFAQRFDHSLAKLGDELQVNVWTLGDQLRPEVGADGSGAFVVAWQSNAQDGYGMGVFARRFDPTGAPVTGDQQVNAFTTEAQEDPSIAVADGGRALVVWSSNLQDGSGDGVYARWLSADGVPEGNEIQLNQVTAAHQDRPDAALADWGSYALMWSSSYQDGDIEGVFGLVVNSNAIFLDGFESGGTSGW